MKTFVIGESGSFWYESASRRAILMTILCLVGTLAGCADLLPPALYKENWRLVGTHCSKREPGKPIDDWFAVLDFPRGKVTRIISNQTPNPDGEKPIRGFPLAYNDEAEVIVWWYHKYYDEETPDEDSEDGYVDVCLYDARKRQTSWIGRKRWYDVSSFAWSRDGKSLAFVATENPGTPGTPTRGSVFIYELATHKLRELADDGFVDRYLGEQGSPVWRKDGKYLYYASINKDVTRIEMATGRKEKILYQEDSWMQADAILAVDGNTIVYVTKSELIDIAPDRKGLAGDRLELVVKQTMTPVRDIETSAVRYDISRAVALYRGWRLRETIVSPSGRFILARDQGYGGFFYVLIDTKACRSYTAAGYCIFRTGVLPDGPCFSPKGATKR